MLLVVTVPTTVYETRTDNVSDGPAICIPSGGVPTRGFEVDAVRFEVSPRESRQVIVVPCINQWIPEYEGRTIAEIYIIVSLS